MSTPGAELTLTAGEAAELHELSLELARTYPATDDEALLRDLPLHAARFPLRIRRFLRAFALDETSGHCVVRGHVLDEDRIGPTPRHWRGRERPGPEFPEELLALLYGASLGEPFAWATQQDGHFVNDVFPIAEFADQLLGTGSEAQLTLHVEDAFHPYRADYLVLSALRNPYAAPTTVAEPDLSELDDADLAVLRAPRFDVVPDTSHLPGNNSAGTLTGDEQRYFDSIERLLADTDKIAILGGSPRRPTLRFDETYMAPPADDPDAVRAYEAMRAHLLGRRTAAVLGPGDLVILNNKRVAHGRDPFRARYDGTDRWLKRVLVTCDLRKSGDLRGRLGPRLIG
jgi:Fe(II)/alpha-ketoglutarate-dependent arginine beta-hydroxylase